MAIDTKPVQAAPPRTGKRSHVWLRRLGKSLIVTGILLLLFVVYELFGTNVIAGRYQEGFRDDIALHGLPSYDRLIPGDALGFISIPQIELDIVFVEGTAVEDLKKGPGHYEDTPLPGEKGNVGIAGHRTTYLHPFWSLDELKPGDLIFVETREGRFRYQVRWTKVVSPGDVYVLDPTDVPSLTLTTCNPRFSASQRLVVRAVQVAGPHAPGVRLARQRPVPPLD